MSNPVLPALSKQQHLLIKLNEECSEIQQAVTKGILFGLADGYPGTDRTNLQDLFNELNDLVGVIEMLGEEGIQWVPDREKVEAKKSKVLEWMGHARNKGTLLPDD